MQETTMQGVTYANKHSSSKKNLYWYDRKSKVFIPVYKACNVDM